MQSRDEILWIVMPVYNEQDSVSMVVDEWVPVLRSLRTPFVFAAIDDGSTDRTPEILNEKAKQNPEIKIYNKTNSGHGRSCILGYEEAVKAGADWILQIDSDGQCDPKYFPLFWSKRKDHNVLMGFRYYRKDGWLRFLVSRALTIVVFLAGRVWLWDPNVPYRLVTATAMRQSLQAVPNDFILSNILISARLKMRDRIKWIPIVFRDRNGGSPSVRTTSFIKQGVLLYKQVVKERKNSTWNPPC